MHCWKAAKGKKKTKNPALIYSVSIGAERVHSPVIDEDDDFKNFTVGQLIN